MKGPRGAAAPGVAPQRRVIKIRRDYKSWVADETLEDYALRYTARTFRKWSIFRVANTAFGAVSFLALEAIGGTLAVQYGFINTFWAALAVALMVFMTSLPIAYYAAKYNLDMDLLTRGAGFGYIGSTITSLIYASFTFIFFAIEATIMAQALHLYLGVAITPSYLFSALIVLPLVGYGITVINRLQIWTQPLWLFLLVLPYICVLWKDPGVIQQLMAFGGESGTGGHFNLLAFGAATSVTLALIAQIGEQVDYLRFMPPLKAGNRLRWFTGVIFAGPGWIVFGAFKLMAGALLAYLALRTGFTAAEAKQPAVMYKVGFGYVFDSPAWTLAVAALFVVVSQIKINVTNAYAGSLAWSNFFARITHSHPGRIVWLVFNVLIALLLMEMGVFDALEHVLGLYSNIAISWVGALVADLVINKPLGLSPPGIEFKRAYLYDINPVGIGALLIASTLSIVAFSGWLGPLAQSFSAFIALGTAFVVAPVIAWLTRGRYYLARTPEQPEEAKAQRCVICEKEYEGEDMATCPAYRGPICSLCCTLDARCHDLCRPGAGLPEQFVNALHWLLPRPLSARINTRLGYYLLLILTTALALGIMLSLLYLQQATGAADPSTLAALRSILLKFYVVLLMFAAAGCWWLVLTVESRYVAQDESNRQTHLLMNEIEAHRQTDAQLQTAIQVAERANQAKSRYLTGISHELRTPLNSILGYAQIVEHDPQVPANRREAMRVIRRSGEHLVSLIDGLLDISKIEAGKLAIEQEQIHFPQHVAQLADMFRLQASEKGIEFVYEVHNELPKVVRIDKKRLGQILINILGNAIKFTDRGRVVFRLYYRGEMARFEIEDSGIGISDADRERIFLPFERGDNAAGYASSSAGLGLTIASMLTTLMGGELTVHGLKTGGSLFRLRLFLPEVRDPGHMTILPPPDVTGYVGQRRRILVVDDQVVDRGLLLSVLRPLGFEVVEAESGVDALRAVAAFQPDIIFMDLNMPGLGGWETGRLLRENALSVAPILVISANVQERGRDNAAGITHDDFLSKPVDIDALLGRLQARLGLEWITRRDIHQAVGTQPVAEALAREALPLSSPQIRPDAEILRELHDLGSLGHIRGILERLDALEQGDARLVAFTQRLRLHVQHFRLNDYMRQLERTDQDV
ncbi:hybrid sensor histidine kinase/response regulator [Acidihalobacter yilgarnensis]|uniref:histidine kinase n=1 Tax=Acidihalobacter yilgarnensis TaxID=2819280 RepID=A0A1D8ILK7_9GAMM|nr:response regulator [Acidihalobacter yilgarnensis]AOU97356.1 hybrid sensor histidine kinase/response regulator [Acidihalobacter yilgarnensis]